MRPLVNTILFLAWIAAYLIAISWVARYRKTQVHALGPTRYTDYRTDKDMGLRLAILFVGAVLLFVAYLATHMVGRYF